LPCQATADARRVTAGRPGERRTTRVHASAQAPVTLGQDDVLDAAGVLPGFTLRLRDVLAELDQRPG
jgi:hypothetical protein